MKFTDCRPGMRVRIVDQNRYGTIVDVLPVLKTDIAPGVVFNVVKVRLDPPYEQSPAGPIVGNVEKPENLELVLRW